MTEPKKPRVSAELFQANEATVELEAVPFDAAPAIDRMLREGKHTILAHLLASEAVHGDEVPGEVAIIARLLEQGDAGGSHPSWHLAYHSPDQRVADALAHYDAHPDALYDVSVDFDELRAYLSRTR